MEACGKIIFVSGGVRSGKSSFAEQLAVEIAEKVDGRLHYIASGQAVDAEMEDRITRHQEQRNLGVNKWTTWERPFSIGELANEFKSNDIVLFDCLTNLLNNLLFQTEASLLDPIFQERTKASIVDGIVSVQKKCHTLIVVSNEILNEPIHSNDLVFVYAKLLGKLNQQVVSLANEAFLVESGIAVCKKKEVREDASGHWRGM